MNTKVMLSEAELRRALRLGHGRAYLHVKHQGIEKAKAQVLNACLHNLVSDPQCEPGRAEWLFGMFRDAAVYSEFSREICRALITVVTDWTWTLDQLCDLAKLMAEHGDNRARETLQIRALLQAFDPVEDTVAVEQWIEFANWLIGNS